MTNNTQKQALLNRRFVIQLGAEANEVNVFHNIAIPPGVRNTAPLL